MEWLSSLRVVAGMFLLRLVVPLLITAALSWALRRLDAEWHPEATLEPELRKQNQDRDQGRNVPRRILS